MLQDFENKGLRITCDEVSSLTLLVTEKQKAMNLNIQKISKCSQISENPEIIQPATCCRQVTNHVPDHLETISR